MNVKTPIGFLSHASDDKDRFVLGFAEKLREHGIELWLDEWEILPGDRIVGKVFEEGLKNAEVIIVVLSNISVAKPWVRAELEVAVVKRIEEGIRIIPLVIDKDCPVPEALKADVRVVINDLNNYEPELKSIVNAVYRIYDKPPLGASYMRGNGRFPKVCVSGDNQPLSLERRPDYATDPTRTP
jgi:hypothetical protein